MLAPWKKSYDEPRECFEKQRYHFADKDLYSQSESCSIVSDSLQPHGLYSPWNSLGQNTGMDSQIKPRSPVLQADSLLPESQGKPKNTGVGSLLLLQQIFPTQESNQGLLRCRWILY